MVLMLLYCAAILITYFSFTSSYQSVLVPCKYDFRLYLDPPLLSFCLLPNKKLRKLQPAFCALDLMVSESSSMFMFCSVASMYDTVNSNAGGQSFIAVRR